MSQATTPTATSAQAIEGKPTMTQPAPKSASSALAGGDYLSFTELDAARIGAVFDTASATQADIAPFRTVLTGKTVILLFEKPSLRTRVTFEVGPFKMGGNVLYFDHSKDRIGARESVKDYAKNLERWVDCIVGRVFEHRILEELAASARIPVVNALSDRYHPCQALADYFTLAERLGGIAALRSYKLAFIGDGNNVCASLMHGAAMLGVQLTVICPKGYEPDSEIVKEAKALGATGGGSISITHDPEAVAGAQAIYTDTWVSMGDEHETAARAAAFRLYRVDEKLMAQAAKGALFMHCLPAHRGEEVTDSVIDSKHSIVYDQAENRMHVQNALLLHLLGGAK